MISLSSDVRTLCDLAARIWNMKVFCRRAGVDCSCFHGTFHLCSSVYKFYFSFIAFQQASHISYNVALKLLKILCPWPSILESGHIIFEILSLTPKCSAFFCFRLWDFCCIWLLKWTKNVSLSIFGSRSVTHSHKVIVLNPLKHSFYLFVPFISSSCFF